MICLSGRVFLFGSFFLLFVACYFVGSLLFRFVFRLLLLPVTVSLIGLCSSSFASRCFRVTRVSSASGVLCFFLRCCLSFAIFPLAWVVMLLSTFASHDEGA